MRLPVNVVAAAATAAAFVTAAVLPAHAECKRYGFEVNDYGKDGPTKDAKSLLDKMIATKMAEKGVKDYHTGKKSVSCEMFLNFVVFDEYTCAAEATVCWGGSQLPSSEQAKAGDGAEPAETASKSDTKEQSKETSTEASKESSTSTEETPAKAVKVSSKTAKAAKKTSMKSIDPEASEKKSVALRVPDPKPQRLQKIEVKSEETSGGDAASTPAVTTEPAAAPASTPAADAPSAPDSASSPKPTTADSTKPGASKPVETGSLAEPAKKTAEHKAEKSASDVAPVKHTASDAGYPTPLPPQPQDTPAP
jgi:hypothetical protein